METREALKTYSLPAVFAISVAGYFAPLYLQIEPGSTSALIYAFILTCWVILFSSLWLATIVYLFWTYKKSVLKKHDVFSSALILLVYIIWYGFAANGYVLTV